MIDITQIDIDTPVLVRNTNTERWVERNFAKYDESTGKFYVWDYQLNSKSQNVDNDDMTPWKFIKLKKERIWED